jgi:hypothetical protein
MSLTTTPVVHVPDTSVSVPGWVRRHLVWLLIGVTVFATAVLVTLTVADNSDADLVPHNGIIEQGSINAIEHRGSPPPATGSLLDRSITAIDRQAGTGAG